MVGGEDGGRDTLICDAATATFSLLVLGATKLAFDAISMRGVGGSNEVCFSFFLGGKDIPSAAGSVGLPLFDDAVFK